MLDVRRSSAVAQACRAGRLAWSVALLAMLVTVLLPSTYAAFTSTAGDGGNGWQAAALQPPSRLRRQSELLKRRAVGSPHVDGVSLHLRDGVSGASGSAGRPER